MGSNEPLSPNKLSDFSHRYPLAPYGKELMWTHPLTLVEMFVGIQRMAPE